MYVVCIVKTLQVLPAYLQVRILLFPSNFFLDFLQY